MSISQDALHTQQVLSMVLVWLLVSLIKNCTKKSYENDSTTPPPVEKSVMGDILFERDLQAESKRLMSYIFGRTLFEKYMDAIKASRDIHNPELAREAVVAAIKKRR